MGAHILVIEDFAIGNIFWFVNPKISSSEPHPHICVGSDSENYIFLFCGTSQFEKKKRYFELNGIAPETLVRIQANPTNTITKDTFINCNEIQSHTLAELQANNTIALKGKVSESELFQIRNGIEISELMEENTKTIVLNKFPEV